MTFAFKLGPIPIRVHAWFFVIAALLGITRQEGPAGVALWSGALVAAALIHELGHALAARACGVALGVELPPLAMTTDQNLAELTPFRRALVSLAGPTASIALGVVATCTGPALRFAAPTLAAIAHYFAWLNLGWGALNLVPVLPLDGGYALLAILGRSRYGRGERLARLFSAGLAVVLGVGALLAHLGFPALLCGVLALQNARGLRARETEKEEMLARFYLSAAFEAAQRDDLRGGIEYCRHALLVSSNRDLRGDAVRLLAYAYVATGAWRPLVQLIESADADTMGDAELEKYERAARELGRVEEAAFIARCRSPQRDQPA
jgi:Zn-dependent protease